MINLFISSYPETNQQRRGELDECLQRNIACTDIGQVFVLAERVEEMQLVEHEKVAYLPVTVRPTFRTFFNCINTVSAPGDINIIANSDIYFEGIPVSPLDNQCFALTRYEVDSNGNVRFLNRRDSQDTWIFKGHVKQPGFADFHLGVPGCDNRVNLELSKMGYQVMNPSLTIKSYHLHANPTDHAKATKRINPPYLRLDAIELK